MLPKMTKEQKEQLEKAKSLYEGYESAVTLKIEPELIKIWIKASGSAPKELTVALRESIKQGIIQVCGLLGVKVNLYEAPEVKEF